jgi:hypothetical protein
VSVSMNVRLKRWKKKEGLTKDENGDFISAGGWQL